MEKFYKNCKQKELDIEEKQKIKEYFDSYNQDKIDYNQFFSSFKILIFYLDNNKLEETTTIKDIINNIPPYLKIEDEFFQNEEGNSFTADKIMSIFFFFEHLCFENLCKTIQDVYKKEIEEDVEDKIRNKLLNKKLNDKLSIKDLGAALRRFISRYLVRKNQNLYNIDENEPLIPLLNRPELWEEKILKINNLEELISQQLGEFNLKVGQSFNLYEIIRGEDEKELCDEIFNLEDTININIKENNNKRKFYKLKY